MNTKTEHDPVCCGGDTCNTATVNANGGALIFKPQIDVIETADEFRILADMPGVAPEQLNVQFEKGELTIEGQMSDPNSGATYLHREFRCGTFRRVLVFRESIDTVGIEAQLKHGLLVVRLPKSSNSKTRKITVQS